MSANKLNQDLNRINNWAFQWKMSFNPDPSKQAQEVIFSRKLQKSTHPTLSFNKNAVTQSVAQKHLGMLFDTKLEFQGHLKSIINKINKKIGLLCKLRDTLPRLPFFRNSFYPSAVIERKKLDLNIRNSESLNVFKKRFLRFIRPERS